MDVFERFHPTKKPELFHPRKKTGNGTAHISFQENGQKYKRFPVSTNQGKSTIPTGSFG